MIKLYYAPDTCALASHIALEEAGAEYSLARIDFAREEQRSPKYLAVNPKGRVPAMATERGILTETPAMLAFIAQSFSQAHLAPLEDGAQSDRAGTGPTNISDFVMPGLGSSPGQAPVPGIRDPIPMHEKRGRPGQAGQARP